MSQPPGKFVVLVLNDLVPNWNTYFCQFINYICENDDLVTYNELLVLIIRLLKVSASDRRLDSNLKDLYLPLFLSKSEKIMTL